MHTDRGGRRNVWLDGGVLLAIAIGLAACTVSSTPDALKIKAWKNRAAILFTNNESATLTECHIDLNDRDTGAWRATLVDSVPVGKTIIVPWHYFRQKDYRPMPSAVSFGGGIVIVGCSVGDSQQQRSATFQL